MAKKWINDKVATSVKKEFADTPLRATTYLFAIIGTLIAVITAAWAVRSVLTTYVVPLLATGIAVYIIIVLAFAREPKEEFMHRVAILLILAVGFSTVATCEFAVYYSIKCTTIVLTALSENGVPVQSDLPGINTLQATHRYWCILATIAALFSVFGVVHSVTSESHYAVNMTPTESSKNTREPTSDPRSNDKTTQSNRCDKPQ
jgi:hypothetical protein